MNPLLRPLDRLMTKNADYEQRVVKTYVNEPHKVRALFLRGLLGFLWAIALILGMNFLPRESFWFTFCSVSLGWLLGRAALRQFRRAQTYRDGWLDGRMQMVSSMAEASQRRLSIEEWLEGELERDQSVMRWL